MNSNTTILNLLKTNGFTQVPNKDWPNTVGDKLKDAVDSVWGLQMRANKWADVFVISLDDGDWIIINDDQIKNIGSNRIEKELIALMNEEYGAGFEGTTALRDKYIKDTPGQRIQQFKTTMKDSKEKLENSFISSSGKNSFEFLEYSLKLLFFIIFSSLKFLFLSVGFSRFGDSPCRLFPDTVKSGLGIKSIT